MLMPTVEDDVQTIKRICKASEDAEGGALLRYSALQRTPRFKTATPEQRQELVKMAAVSNCRHDQRSTVRKHRKEPVKVPLNSLTLEIYSRYLEHLEDGMVPKDAEIAVANKLCVGVRTVQTSVTAASGRASKDRFERDVRAKFASNAQTPSGIDQLILNEDLETLRQAVSELPQRERDVVELVYFHNTPQNVAALELHLTINQLEKSLAHALNLLRQQVTE